MTTASRSELIVTVLEVRAPLRESDVIPSAAAESFMDSFLASRIVRSVSGSARLTD